MSYDSCRCGHTTSDAGPRSSCALCEGDAPKPSRPSPALRDKLRESLREPGGPSDGNSRTLQEKGK